MLVRLTFRSKSVVACSGDNVVLLLLREVDELNSISGYTDREVSVLFLLRMCLCVEELLNTEYVYVEVVSTLCEITVENVNEVVLLVCFGVTESRRVDRLSIGDTVERPYIRDLRYRVQGSDETVLLCAVCRVSTG